MQADGPVRFGGGQCIGDDRAIWVQAVSRWKDDAREMVASVRVHPQSEVDVMVEPWLSSGYRSPMSGFSIRVMPDRAI